MVYKIYKLKFQTPVHFGSDRPGTSLEKSDIICHSDTFFSALCQEYLKLYDDIKLLDFIELFEFDKIKISSLFPYNNVELFVPKPALLVDRQNADNQDETQIRSLKKKMKKLEFISIYEFDDYINSLKTGKSFEYDEDSYNVAKYSLNQKVGIPRDKTNDKNLLYQVGTYSFYDDCGLYFVAQFEEEKNIETFEQVLESLQYSGIGGKRSSGYGKFELTKNIEQSDEGKMLIQKLELKSADYQMSISLLAPSEEEIEQTDFKNNNFYNLINRSGYVYSEDYNENFVKKKSMVMFKEGSCFSCKLDGAIYDVSDNGHHAVYRYGKNMTIGVNVCEK